MDFAGSEWEASEKSCYSEEIWVPVYCNSEKNKNRGGVFSDIWSMINPSIMKGGYHGISDTGISSSRFFTGTILKAPDARWEVVEMDGVAPEYFHSTSMFPEYFKIQGKWVLAEESRMDSSVVICPDGHLEVVENRNLKKGDKVILGRSEGCEEGHLCPQHRISDRGRGSTCG